MVVDAVHKAQKENSATIMSRALQMCKEKMVSSLFLPTSEIFLFERTVTMRSRKSACNNDYIWLCYMFTYRLKLNL